MYTYFRLLGGVTAWASLTRRMGTGLLLFLPRRSFWTIDI